MSQNAQVILDQMPDGALELGHDGALLLWNQRVVHMLDGIDLDDATRSWFDLFHAEDQANAHMLWVRALETPGQWHTLQARLKRDVTATPHSYEWRVCRLSSEHTTLRCVVRSLQDHFEDLFQKKRDMRSLYERTPIMAHAIDTEGCLIMVSDRWLETLGYTREEVIGRPSTDFLSEESRQNARLTLPEFFARGYCRDIPYQMVTKDGRLINVELSATAEYDEQGQITRSFAVIVDVSRRNALFAELQHQHNMLEAFFEGMPHGIIMTTADRTIVRVNKAMRDIFGYQENELIGKNSAMLFLDEESYERASSLIDKLESEGSHEQRDAQVYKRKNGELFLAKATGAPYWDEAGRIQGFFGMIEDLSELERVRKEASNERELTQTFFETVPSGAFIISLSGHVLRANSEAHLMFGYEPGELIGVHTSSFHVHDYDAAQIERGISGGESLEFLCKRRDGTTFPARLSGAPYHDERGEHVGFVALLQNISEELAQREAIAHHASLMDAFFEAIPYATVIADVDRKIIRANQAVTRIFGYHQDDVLDKKTEIFYASKALFEHTGIEFFNRELTNPKASASIQFQRKKGDTFEGELIAAKIFDAADQVAGYLGLMRDITQELEQKRQLEEQNQRLEQANKDLERFAYIASHDLQEPLRKISSFLSLIEMDLEGSLDETTSLYFHYVRDGAERLKNLIHDLLAYSRADNIPDLVPCQPMQIFAQSVEEYRQMLDEHGASLDTDDRSGSAMVMSHDSVLSQVFSNLLSNSIKYAHPDRQLALHVSCTIESPTHLRFAMRDNGMGIEPRHQERVFEIFQRLHRQDEIKGQGIGLAICKKIITRQGGQFGVESDGHSGSTFWFTLKRAHQSRN